MFCSNCGMKLMDNDRFCSNCGKPVYSASRPSAPPAVNAARDETSQREGAGNVQVPTATASVPRPSASVRPEQGQRPMSQAWNAPLAPAVQGDKAEDMSAVQEKAAAPQNTSRVPPVKEEHSSQSAAQNHAVPPAWNTQQGQTARAANQAPPIRHAMSEQMPPKSKKGIKRWHVVLIAVCAVVAAAAVVFVLVVLPWLKDRDESEDILNQPPADSDVNSGKEGNTAPALPDDITEPEGTDALTEKEVYDIYSELVQELLTEYGRGHVINNGGDYYFYTGGLITVRLIDFDGDGTEELYCVYSDEEYIYTQAVYGIKDGRLYEYLPPESCSNNGTDVSPTTNLVEKDGKVYLKEGIHVAIEGDYCTIEDGRWTAVHSYSTPFDMEDEYVIDGRAVTEEEYLDFIEGYDEVEKIFYSYFEEDYYDDCLEKTDDALRTVLGDDYSTVMEEYREEEGASEQTSAQQGEYILPDSSSRLLTAADIASLSDSELELARNEIYARHGRRFDTPKIMEYFETKSWYSGTIEPEDFDYSVLSEIERANVDFLLAHEG